MAARTSRSEAETGPPEEFDAFAGGYPVPPQGDQVLPEFATVLPGSSGGPPEDDDDDAPGVREPATSGEER